VLFGEEGSDEADDRGPGGEDADDVGAPPDLFVRPLLGLLDQIRGTRWPHQTAGVQQLRILITVSLYAPSLPPRAREREHHDKD
jgi:hypothetical protein